MEFLTKKVIKGRTYYYLQYEGYAKSLGAALPGDIKSAFLDFFGAIAEKKYKSLGREVIKQFPYSKLEELEKMHYWHVCVSQSEYFRKEYVKMFLWFAILFTFNSNRSEGSRVTRPEIEKIALAGRLKKPKTKTDREIFNSIRALNYAFSKKMKWNAGNIKKIHKMLLENLDDPEIIGKWKNENNVAPGNQPTVDYKQVKTAMNELMIWFHAEAEKKTYPPLLALGFYCRFERIHPFLDGNGRIGRILLNAILYKYKYLPVIFFTKNHREHCTALSMALEGRFAKLNTHFFKQAKKTYEELSSLK